MFWTDQFALCTPRFEKDHTWSMWDFCLPALVVTNKPKWQPRMKKWFVRVCSDITSARESRLKVIPQRAQTSPNPVDPQTKGKAEAEAANKTPSPLFLGPRLASRGFPNWLTRHGRFEVSASWRVGTPENLESRNETRKPKRNDRWVTKRGVGKWWHGWIWCLVVAGCLI